jgi:hypothetical protein
VEDGAAVDAVAKRADGVSTRRHAVRAKCGGTVCWGKPDRRSQRRIELTLQSGVQTIYADSGIWWAREGYWHSSIKQHGGLESTKSI